ncbi:MAG: response regulator [Limnohabitans sp.]|nr:response regulator [Limnohabitans sp.]
MEKQIVYLKYFLWLLLLPTIFYAQQKPSVKSVEKQIKEARNALTELETEKSMDIAQNALSSAFLLNNNSLIAKAYMVFGCNFIEFADTKKAKEYFFKSIHYANLAKNDTIKDLVYNNIGAVYSYYENNFEQGILYYKKGLFFTEKINNPVQVTYNALNIAGAYVDKGMYNNAIPFLNKAEKLMNKHQEKEARLSYNALWARYYSHIGNKTKAEEYFDKAISFGLSDKDNLLDSYLAEVYLDYAIHFEKFDDFKTALKYSRLSENLKEKVYSESRSENVKKAEDKIKIKEYEKHISYIEKQKEENEINLKKTYAIIGLFIVVIIVLSILIYVLFTNNKNKRKSFLRLKNINHELEKAKIKAEEATQLKTQFVSTITHELRTPLYGVIGISDILANEYPEIKNSKYLESLKFSAQYLLSLVNDVLQIHKISEKKIIIEKSSFKLADKLEAIKNSFYTQCLKTKNRIEIELDSNLPDVIIGDRLRFSQILMNLISNSLKFTAEGLVTIKVKKLSNQGEFVKIQFEVIDTGIGIAPENQSKIFEEFVQIERREEDYQGTGLGLPIVKKLVALFGGNISLNSELGKGTTVVFDLNFELDDSQYSINNFEMNIDKSKNINVLLAEDNKINQMVSEKILKSFGFEVVIVDNGIDAIEACKQNLFDIILMDLNMPKYDGYKSTAKIRQLGINTPIIALTAFDKSEIHEQCIQAGMDDVIMKPFEKQQLYNIISTYVKMESEVV